MLLLMALLLLPPPPASERVEHDGLAAASPAAPAAVPLVCDGQVHGEAELVLVLMGLMLLRGRQNTRKYTATHQLVGRAFVCLLLELGS